MAQVRRLKGESCAHYVRRHCTRTRTPEASAAARCTLLEARRQVGARTLDRLERLKRLGNPSDREVGRRHLIQKNLAEMTRLSCPGFVASGEGGPLCMHQHLVYCLLLLPDCPGRCDDFVLRRGEEQAAGGRA